MSKATYWQRGETIDYKNGTGKVIEAGEVLELGALIGVAGEEIQPDAVGGVHIVGTFYIPKATGEIKLGDCVAFADGSVKKAGNEDSVIGVAVADAAADDATALVKINVGSAVKAAE